jgi:hypothetical protein
MYTLILPVNGQSTRFPNIRPKWLLTHPTGNCMLLESILGLDFQHIKHIYIITNKEHIKQYDFIDGIKKQFISSSINLILEFIILDGQTTSQVETIRLAIQKAKITGPIAIKDCDNYFKAILDKVGNFIYVADLNTTTLINPTNKCYIKYNIEYQSYDVVEKQIISNIFGCGLYTFKSAKLFLNSSINTSYISNIYSNIKFTTKLVTDYIDWGTKEDWQRYCSKFKVLLIDIDGILVQNSSEYMTPKWGTTLPLSDNVNRINELYHSGYYQIILTTARTNDIITKKQLNTIGLKYHKLVSGLLHSCNRILINDYSNTNIYPTAQAINLPRNHDTLSEYI